MGSRDAASVVSKAAVRTRPLLTDQCVREKRGIEEFVVEKIMPGSKYRPGFIVDWWCEPSEHSVITQCTKCTDTVIFGDPMSADEIEQAIVVYQDEHRCE